MLRNSEAKIHPLEALVLFRWHRSTEPMDKVSGFLGMTRDIGLIHDYQLGLKACYIATSRAILSHSEVLDILDSVVSPQPLKRRRLPSWVPDWSQKNVSGNSELGWTYFDRMRLNTCREADLAIGLARPRFKDDDTIVLVGLEIDSIVELDKTIPSSWMSVMDLGPPSLEESEPVNLPFLGSWVSAPMNKGRSLISAIMSALHMVKLFLTTATDLRYFDQWVRFSHRISKQNPGEYPNFIEGVF